MEVKEQKKIEGLYNSQKRKRKEITRAEQLEAESVSNYLTPSLDLFQPSLFSYPNRRHWYLEFLCIWYYRRFERLDLFLGLNPCSTWRRYWRGGHSR